MLLAGMDRPANLHALGVAIHAFPRIHSRTPSNLAPRFIIASSAFFVSLESGKKKKFSGKSKSDYPRKR